MKTFLIILGSLILFFTAISLIRVKILLSFSEAEKEVKLKILGCRFTLYPRKEKPQKPKKKSEENEPQEEKKEESKEEKPFKLSDLFHKGRILMELLKKMLSLLWHKLFRKIHFDDTYIRLNISEEDAYDTAMRYAAVSAGVYSGLGLLSDLFTVKNSQVVITPDFLPDRFFYEIRTQISLRIGSLFAVVFSLLWLAFRNRNLIKDMIKGEET